MASSNVMPWLHLTFLLVFHIFLIAPFCNCQPQNLETFFPDETSSPAPEPTISPAPPVEPPPPPTREQPASAPAASTSSSSSNSKIAKAVAATAASTLVVSGLLFFIIRRCLKKRRKEETGIISASTPGDRRVVPRTNEFERIDGNVRGLIVDENGLDVIYWRKLEGKNNSKKGLRKEVRPIAKDQEQEVEVEEDGNVGSRRGKRSDPIQEIPLLRGKSSASHKHVLPEDEHELNRSTRRTSSRKTKPPAPPPPASPPLPPPPSAYFSAAPKARSPEAPPPPPASAASPPLPPPPSAYFSAVPKAKSPEPPPPPPASAASPPLPPPPSAYFSAVPKAKSPEPPPPPPASAASPPLPPPPSAYFSAVPKAKSPEPPPPPPASAASPPLPPPPSAYFSAVPKAKSPEPPPPPPTPPISDRKSPAPPPPPPPVSARKTPAPPPPPMSSSLRSSSKPPPTPIEMSATGKPSGESVLGEGNDKVKLKPLHWDKVNANADHSMVWDKMGRGSFRVDQDLMEALFGFVATSKRTTKGKNNSTSPSGDASASSTNTFILDSRKSQNVAIVLKSLAVSREEILDALNEGQGLNADTIEKLSRVAPTEEEQSEILDYKGDPARLAVAESFLYDILKAVPSAFKRLNAMLFRLNYDSEILEIKEYLNTLELGCKELRNRGLFVKLLEAVLKAGNRMNAGTSRGNAQAFNLSSLRKLSDVKSTNGKTTLLHFVVEEVVRSEGKRCVLNRDRSLNRSGSRRRNSNGDSENSVSDEQQEKEYLRLGLPFVGGISAEFSNVKKAALVDYNNLVSSISALVTRITEFQVLVSQCRNGKGGNFVKEMDQFLRNAEDELRSVRDEQTRVMQLVNKTTEYYQGGASKDTTENLEIFVIVKDFLGMVDQACIEIARNMQKRKIAKASSG